MEASNMLKTMAGFEPSNKWINNGNDMVMFIFVTS
jgi:hypothetical protein